MRKPTALMLTLLICVLLYLVAPLSLLLTYASPPTLASTELLNYGGMSSSEITTWLNYVEGQNISLFICRLNSFGEWQSGTSSYISKTKQIITAANLRGIDVAVDLHTWFTTWRNYFDSSGQYYDPDNRVDYITYVRNVLTAFENSNVYAFMVLNEPDSQSANSGENQFILDVLSNASEVTDKPLSVRFMGAYSPTTGHYSSAINTACDFLCRNTYWTGGSYWDPDDGGYGQTLMTNDLAAAHGASKELWITEFGKTKGNSGSAALESQRDYVERYVEWATGQGIDKIFCWASQPDVSGETFNIWTGYTPHPAFYELVNGGDSDLPPTYTTRTYNTTVAGAPCLFSALFADDVGLSKSYFSSNNTGAWVNTTIISLSGTSDWANQSLTLNNTASARVYFRWYTNDTADQWTTTPLQWLITQAGNIPEWSNPAVSSVKAGDTIQLSVEWQGFDGLSGRIFGWNNSGSWSNDTWTGWTGTPTTALAFTEKVLTIQVGVVVEWAFYANDTDDDWGSTSGLFITVEQGDWYFFLTEALYDQNNLYGGLGYPCFTDSNGTITAFTYASRGFNFTVSADAGISVTDLYVGAYGVPLTVENAASSYDAGSRTLTLTVTHSSAETVILDWGGLINVRFDSGSSLGFQNTLTRFVLLTVTNGSFTGELTSLELGIDRGTVKVTTTNSSEFEVYFSADINSVTVSGDEGRAGHAVSRNESITSDAADQLIISWSVPIQPFLPIMFIIGMVGLVSMIGGPCYAVVMARSGDLRGALQNGMLYTALGFGLFIAWVFL